MGDPKKILASDCNCCEEGCENKAVAFYPMIDPDIPPNAYCKECLDKAQTRVLIMLMDDKPIKKKNNGTNRIPKK